MIILMLLMIMMMTMMMMKMMLIMMTVAMVSCYYMVLSGLEVKKDVGSTCSVI